MAEKETVTIVVVRHPEKDGDKITAKGAEQAFAAAQALKEANYSFDRLFYSGAYRTLQSGFVMAAGLHQCELRPEENQCLNFGAAVQSAYDGDSQAFINELTSIKEMGYKTISECCKAGSKQFNEYVETAGKNLGEGMIAIAKEMMQNGQKTALALSHSPYTETAVLNPKNTPMGLGESDAIEYVIQNGKIVSSKLIPAPITGKPLV
ncbi:hypothetical protein K8R62_01685 [bacterium]|nr:hypothetical protein [bacterium]